MDDWLTNKKTTSTEGQSVSPVDVAHYLPSVNHVTSQNNSVNNDLDVSAYSHQSVDEDGEFQRVQGTVIPSDPRRPARVLLTLIDKCPLELIQRISPGSKRLKNNLKVPLVLLCWSCGVLNGSALTFLKVCGEITNSPEAAENVFFALLMGALGCLCAGINIYILNLSMRFYPNLDVMPIYQSMVLMFMMVAGLVVLNESALYDWGELALLYGSAGFVVLGIYILTQKQNVVVLKD